MTLLPVVPSLSLSLALLSAGSFAQDGEAVPKPSSARSAATGSIFEVMEALESEKDAKCHSTACRVENYVFGTPLTDTARDRKILLQKELLREVWGRAGRDDFGKVDASALATVLRAVLEAETNVLGDLKISFPTGTRAEPVRIPLLRKTQYASIAYALRTILAVQQDEAVLGASGLGELTEETTEMLKDALDTVTLCALSVADEQARRESRAEIDHDLFEQAWRTLVAAAGTTVVDRSGGPDPTGDPFDVLRSIIAQKIAAYERYNALDPQTSRRRFAVNAERFYALYKISPDEEQQRAFLETYDNAVVSFAHLLLSTAAREARSRNHRLIRSDDAVAAVQWLTPHEVDTLEDVHFFPNLARSQRVTLEAYDCDSFRDLGFHWGYIARAIEAADRPEPAPDPFAAEILAESVSQFGVLVLRLAGEVARTKSESPALREVDLQRAVQRILKRAEDHRTKPPRSVKTAPIASAGAAPTRTEPTGAGLFADVTEESGLAFLHRSSNWLSEFRRERTAGPPTFSGGGVAAEDVDGDGDIDLLFAGGIGLGLFLDDGAGRFRDVTAAAGLTWRRPDGTFGEARTPLIVDLDNDGRQDLLVTYANDAHRVWRNTGEEGRLVFEDVTARAGLGGEGVVGGAVTVFDFDRDGLLDVYHGYFGNYLADEMPAIDRDNRNGLENRLFRNLGDFRFQDVTEGSGTDDTGWCQAVSHADLDRDGLQDLIVANDFGRNTLLRNLGGGKFEDIAPRLGVTNAFHSMNVGISDLNADGYPDVYISNIATLVKDNKYVLPDVYTPMDFNYESMARMMVKEADELYLSRVEEGRLVSFELSRDVERGSTSTGWAWDAEFFDYDHDGDDDLYVVNGTNDYSYYDAVHREATEEGEVVMFLSHARESNVLFENEGGKLRNVSERSGADLLLNSRSTAYLDFDRDGDLDVALNNFHAPAVLLENRAPVSPGNWMMVRLVGAPSRASNRDAIGARILAKGAGGLRVWREIQGGSGYLSMNPRLVHFGLGAAATADLEILWPNGERQEVRGLAAGRTWVIHQAEDDEAGKQD